MRHLAILLTLALTACSGESAPPEREIRPEPAAVEPAPRAEAPTPTPEPEIVVPEVLVPEVVPPDQTFRALTLPERVELPRLRVRRAERTMEGEEYLYGAADLSWEVAQHPDPAVRAAIASWAEEHAEHTLSDRTSAVHCSLLLAHERAVVSACSYYDEGDRSGGEVYETIQASKIEDGHLVPFDMQGALVPRATFAALVRERARAEGLREPAWRSQAAEGTAIVRDAP